jgi:hypothetical protein
LYIIFNGFFENLLNKTLVEYLFSKVDSIWYVDIIGVLILIYIVVNSYLKFQKYTPSLTLFLILFSISIIYTYYRFIGNSWVFTPFSFYEQIKYLDIILVFFICQLVIIIPKKSDIILKPEGADSFFEDIPLNEKGDDILGYKPYSDNLAKKIKNSVFEKAFAIGINGKWGIGKTSFIDLLNRELINDSGLIIIKFNPWNSHNANSIIKDFFETFQEAITPYHSSIARLLMFYADKLISLNSNTITQSIQTTASILNGFESINSLHKDVNETLKKINKKIVIYIDDLDRLDKSEIIEVIRLIRNTANFYNTVFIVAYDRNYVVNALEHHNSYNQESFLDKIFQIEINLPQFNKDVLKHELVKKIKNKIPSIFETNTIHDKIEFEIPNVVHNWIQNLRDVTRLSNNLIMNLPNLVNEVDINDFIKLEILRLKFPSVYELIYTQSNNFLDTSSDFRNKYVFTIKKLDDRDIQDLQPDEKYINSYIWLHLFRNYKKMSVPFNEIENINDLVNSIFGTDNMLNYKQHSNLSIVNPSRFYIYFQYKLIDSTLSEKEFTIARSSSIEIFQSKIANWVEKGLENELINRFKEINSFDDREDFEKIISSIFYMARLPSTKSDFYHKGFVSYDLSDLTSKLNNKNNRIDNKFYQNQTEKYNFSLFIQKILNESNSPYIFDAYFLNHLNNEFIDDNNEYSILFILPKNRVKDLLLSFFRNHCNELSKFESSIWYLFYYCKETILVPQSENTFKTFKKYMDESIDIMRNFILNKDIDSFLFEIISPDKYNTKICKIDNIVLDIFGNWQNFEEELNKIDSKNSKHIDEFKKFYTVFKNNNFSNYVEFEFKEINVIEKIRK